MPEPTKKTNQERIKEITDSIETGIRELFESDRFTSYLSTMSRFHRYSVNNQILIHMQRPDATQVAGFNAWKDKFGRHVKKGEKGIQILAPTATMKKIQQTVLDPDTKAPMLDEDGNVMTEEKTVRTVSNYFKPVTVFDVSQTEGKPLPHLAMPLIGDVAHYEAFVEALRRSSPVPIEFENMAVTTDGYFSADKQRIAIRPGMSQVQTVAAIVHEIGHSKLHDYDRLQAEARADGDKEPVKKDRRTEEVEAESVAYAVCQYYGIETSENSFGYIAAWSKGQELKELKASLNTITQTVSALITDLDRNLAEIRKERGLDQEVAAEEPEQAAPTEEAPAVIEPAATAPVDATPSQPDLYQAYANAVCDHAEELFHAGLIPLPFPGEKEEFAQQYADLLRRSGPKNAQAALDEYAEKSGMPTPEALQTQLNDLKALWNSDMSYALKSSELHDGTTGYISSFTPSGEVDNSILFSGPTIVCKKVLDKLQAGEMTAEQAAALSEEWNSVIAPVSAEGLYQVKNNSLVHLQLTEAGYDYTVYDAATGREKGSGQIAAWVADRKNYETLIQGALSEVCEIEKLSFVGNQELPLTHLAELLELRKNPPKLDKYPMPDDKADPDALKKANCPDAAALLPICRDRAMELFAEGFTIYAIDEHGDPMMCFEEADLTAAGDRPLAMEKYEWEKSPDFRALIRDSRIENQADREAAFLRYPGHAFAIYQVRSDGTDENRYRRFTDLDGLQKLGMKPTRDHYDLIYTVALSDHPTVNDPEDAFRVFNLERPADFGGHSLSVSDIVAFRRDGMVAYHYCDSVGFEEIPNFQPENYLKNAEMAVEDDYNSIDGIINNGPKDQGPPKTEPTAAQEQTERPSLRARLMEELPQPEPQDRKEDRQRHEERSV